MIPFNIPLVYGNEQENIKKVLENRKICGDGKFTNLCSKWLEENTGCKKTLLTTSCTHALELAALLLDIKENDEVIMPSYTFVSTANAFSLRGAKIVFVDVRPDTMNIDEAKIEAAITNKTKAIIPMHYGSVACEMDKIMQLAEKYNLFVVEDAAQGFMAKYKGKVLGTIGHLGTYSFHETKNVHCGEGGALLINDEKFSERAEIIREKGTDRSRFLRGQVDKYSWVDIGSSYLPSELNAAFLYSQFSVYNEIHNKRVSIWKRYFENFRSFKNVGIQDIPNYCEINGHLFYVKVKDIEQRQALIDYLKSQGIQTAFHYVPLHSATAGVKFAIFNGEDKFTTKESERLLRLPFYYELRLEEIDKICENIKKYFQ